jgi:tetratricopeptide (TPR) repeat protein
MKNFLSSQGSKWAISTVITLALSQTGCVTMKNALSGLSGDAKKKDARIESGEMVVVQQAGARKPLISKFDREQWVSIRRNTNKSHIKAYAALAAGEWEVAIKEAHAYLKTTPKDKVALTILASSLIMQKNYTLAGHYAKTIERHHGITADSQNILGITTLFQSGNQIKDLLRAQKYFASSFEKSESEIAAGLNLGQLQLELGHSEAAVDTFKEVKDRCNQCKPAVMGAGIALSRVGKYDAAQSEFDIILDRNSGDREGLYRMALLYKNGFQDDDAAMDTLQELISESRQDDALQRRARSVVSRIRDKELNKSLVASKPKAQTAPKIAAEPENEQSSIPEIENEIVTSDIFDATLDEVLDMD